MDRVILGLASTQSGLVTRAQLLDHCSESAVCRLIDSGRLEVIHPGVYRIAGSPPSLDQRFLAATLAAGGLSALSFMAAAMHWKINRIVVDRPHITVVHAQIAKLRGV